MSEIKVKSGTGEQAVTVSVDYAIPDTVAGLVDKYGEEQVVSLAGRALVLQVQAMVRQKVATGANGDALQAAVDAWVPGVRGPATKKSPYERAESALAHLSQDELAALLKEYKGKHGK